MSYSPMGPPDQRPLWQVLLAPMLLVSLGLHGLLLLIPVAPANEAVIPPPDPEQDNIAITRLPPAAADTTSDSPTATVPAAPPQAMQPRSTQPVAAQPMAPARQEPSQQQATPARSAPPRPARGSTAAAAAQRALPSLSGQGNDSNPSAVARVTPPRPAVPSPEPTISPLSQNRREQILAYAASLDFPPERLDQLAAAIWQRYGYSSRNTSRNEYTANRQQWQHTLQQETGLANLTATEDRTDFAVSFDRRACLPQPPGEVKVGFVVNPDGSFRQEPVVLRSSGYTLLNQQALETIRQYEPPAAERIKAYTATVETRVDYGPQDCLKPPQQPSDTSADT